MDKLNDLILYKVADTFSFANNVYCFLIPINYNNCSYVYIFQQNIFKIFD